MDQEREVNFQYYCPKCKYATLNENQDPCDECLAYPSNTDSAKPIYFKEKE